MVGEEMNVEVIDETGALDATRACRAAEAGKHVLINGPLAASVAEGERVIAACAAAGVKLMVGPSARFLPTLQVVKESLDAGKLGEPGLLRIHRWEQDTLQPSLPLLLDLTCEIDLACFFFRRPPVDIWAGGEMAYVQLHLGFAGGGMALIDLARTLPAGEGYFSLSLIGSTGAAYSDDHHDRQLLFGRGRAEAPLTGQGSAHLRLQREEFEAAIREGREPSPSGSDGLRALRVAEAAARSLATGQVVRLEAHP
jgi:myo-inositol 2-dehydrogenase/D-chiro-inositol 1-dehydrogenase